MWGHLEPDMFLYNKIDTYDFERFVTWERRTKPEPPPASRWCQDFLKNPGGGGGSCHILLTSNAQITNHKTWLGHFFQSFALKKQGLNLWGMGDTSQLDINGFLKLEGQRASTISPGSSSQAGSRPPPPPRKLLPPLCAGKTLVALKNRVLGDFSKNLSKKFSSFIIFSSSLAKSAGIFWWSEGGEE